MKVLLATDGSPCSWHAMQEAIRLLPLEAAKVTLVTVAVPPRMTADPIGAGLAYIPVMAEIRREAEQALEDARRMLEASGVVVTPILREGDPTTELLAVAAEVHPDMICVGSHGRGPLGRIALGSVSESLLHRWPGPVMVVRQPTGTEQAGNRTVASVMTPRPVCVQADQPVDEVARLMRDQDTGFIPVLEAGVVIGVITDRDMVVRALADGFDPYRAPVIQFCTKPAVWVAPAMPVSEAVALMERHHIRRLVVLDGREVVGVMALGDLAETLPRVAEHALVEISKSAKTLRHSH